MDINNYNHLDQIRICTFAPATDLILLLTPSESVILLFPILFHIYLNQHMIDVLG
jgi:hypothetical protein